MLDMFSLKAEGVLHGGLGRNIFEFVRKKVGFFLSETGSGSTLIDEPDTVPYRYLCLEIGMERSKKRRDKRFG
jgi:hypothetical protein